MIIVADSGSTKTNWRIFASGERIEKTQTLGLNPHQTSESVFSEEIKASSVSSWSKREVEEIYFYGSGITGEDMQLELAARFRQFFGKAKLSIASDLLGAARALLGKESGFVGILGTGSNSGWYNGNEITRNIPPLGYVLGDEGSGNALGRRLISSFLRDELPNEIKEEFIQFFPDYSGLITKVYSGSQPSRFLASFVPFIYKFREHPTISEIIQKEFSNYFDLLKGYNGIAETSLVGSVAYCFKDTLGKVAEDRGIRLVEVLQSPIDRLTLYHKDKIT